MKKMLIIGVAALAVSGVYAEQTAEEAGLSESLPADADLVPQQSVHHNQKVHPTSKRKVHYRSQAVSSLVDALNGDLGPYKAPSARQLAQADQALCETIAGRRHAQSRHYCKKNKKPMLSRKQSRPAQDARAAHSKHRKHSSEHHNTHKTSKRSKA